MAVEVRLSREMRLIDITMIGVGAMIGAGIFVLTGMAAGTAGPALLVVFGLNGLIAIIAAMSYAELGGAIHGAGGGYLYVKRSLPNPSGFLAGWANWFAQAVACALYALGFGAYFKEVLSVVGIHNVVTPLAPVEIWLAVAICLVFAVINARGASEAGKAGNVVTIGKIFIIGAFILAGLWTMAYKTGWHASMRAFTPFMTNGWTGIIAAMGLTFIAFEGYEIIAQTSEEVENPKRNVPLAVMLSLIIVIPIYLLVAFVAVGATVPPVGTDVTTFLGEQKEIALVAAADQFVVGGGLIILVGGLLSTISALNATIYSSSRVAFAMARDASLPQALARVHPTRGSPHIAIMVSTALIIVMAITLPIEDVAAAASVMFFLLFAAVSISVIRLRKNEPDLDRGFKVPFMPVTPIIGMLAMLGLAGLTYVTYPKAWLVAAGWIGVGVVVYYTYSRNRETAFQARTSWMERIDRDEYRVLIALSSSRSLPGLMEVGLGIAQARGGEVVLVHVVEVSESNMLATQRQAPKYAEHLLEQAMAFARDRGVQARPVIKIGHRISHSLVQTAREEECNFLVIGQPNQQSIFERFVSSVVEKVLQQAPCQVAVVYGKFDRTSIKRITIPVTWGPNSELAAKLAPAFSTWFDADAHAVTMIDRTTRGDESKEHVEHVSETLRAAEFADDFETVRIPATERGFLSAINPQELVIIGAPSSGAIVPVFGDTMPAAIARHNRNPVIVVRAVEERQARRSERAFFARK